MASPAQTSTLNPCSRWVCCRLQGRFHATLDTTRHAHVQLPFVHQRSSNHRAIASSVVQDLFFSRILQDLVNSYAAASSVSATSGFILPGVRSDPGSGLALSRGASSVAQLVHCSWRQKPWKDPHNSLGRCRNDAALRSLSALPTRTEVASTRAPLSRTSRLACGPPCRGGGGLHCAPLRRTARLAFGPS